MTHCPHCGHDTLNVYEQQGNTFGECKNEKCPAFQITLEVNQLAGLTGEQMADYQRVNTSYELAEMRRQIDARKNEKTFG